MSQKEFLNNTNEVIHQEYNFRSEFFTIATLKLILIIMVAVYLILVCFRKYNGDEVSRKGTRHRRKFIESWNEETKKKFVDLKNKTADVKDFSKFKQSDVENITVLNTLINACITKLYDSTKFQDDVKREDTYDQQNLTNSKDHSNKIYENPVSKVKSARFSGDDCVYHLKVCDPKSFENKSNLKINDYKMMAESEQGSMIDFNKIADKHNYQNEYLSSYQRRSILKLKKTVCFNLHRNQTRIIVA